MLTKVVIFLGLLGATSLLHGQASPTASRTGDLKIGGGFSSAASDYGDRFNGGAAYFDFDFRPRLGITGEFHFVKDQNDLYEKTYEIGGRYFRDYGRFVPFVKVLYGRGVFNFPVNPDGFRANLAYNLVAAGGGADFKVKPYLYVRADWEYQQWFQFAGSSLTPNIVTLGAAYRFR
ncbi:outer membrane beta-barrel protein [Granulicella sp. S190]|uniref:outer membrane beta-barrel protein n=1 Tax=Granulicella sp. S190 TaxID=1747226 RepID=UPI00131C9A02|nr:outer membrane beta-barrel protein [Granulicella sp. S190]